MVQVAVVDRHLVKSDALGKLLLLVTFTQGGGDQVDSQVREIFKMVE
jgi:hypothetical protein